MLLYGGSAGSLKTETMLAAAAQLHDNPYHRAVIFRRQTHPDLEYIIDRSRLLYPQLGARFVGGAVNEWRFPSGARIRFGACHREQDVESWRGQPHNFIGIDESTQWPEKMVRFLIGWLRSPHPDLQERACVRLATNPGGIGAAWHKKVFLGAKCLCDECARVPVPGMREPYRIYGDAHWIGDNDPVKMSTCFIPGKITDHKLLGDDYADKTLGSLPRTMRLGLIRGCWQVFEGQYFDIWDPARMVVPRNQINEQSWWRYWTGTDYGFSISSAASHLLTRGEPTKAHPFGRIYVLDEFTSEYLDSAARRAGEYAKRMVQRFGANRIIESHYLSPDAWSVRGDETGHCLMDQMVEATGEQFEQASNDRAGGAMLMHQMLDDGRLAIADTCRLLIECIPSRLHDLDAPEKVLKVKGDPLDDVYDSARYALFSHANVPRVPRDLRIERGLSEITDPTAHMLQRRKLEAEMDREGQPFSYMPNGFMGRGWMEQ